MIFATAETTIIYVDFRVLAMQPKIIKTDHLQHSALSQLVMQRVVETR